jgi:hypothetical protein
MRKGRKQMTERRKERVRREGERERRKEQGLASHS